MDARTAGRRRVQDHLARAQLHRAGGRYDEAERELRAALRVARSTVGPASAEVAEAASALGILLESVGRPAEAEGTLRLAVDICERIHGHDDPRLTRPLNALGAVRQRRGDLTEAERLYLRVIGIMTGTAT
ncbi:tetratricopeptide repeat protein [Streptomyces sp.]|uniref:tetratricopeptide repeat protein n=1 Tax=Streptomyces sp. TaxID=1931 RepID=UPI002D78252A|nr:tetratricopeptide repeat protein [Streptomyces sp.]HET6358981.1 tetratricopeptide repeat protein [Streptomyces sp.]